jgi:hypothetical protein
MLNNSNFQEVFMKKIIAVLLAALLLAVPFTALAHIDNANLGNVPKTLSAPNIDGIRDAYYDNGLHIPIRTLNNGSELDAIPLGGGGDAWFLWDDDYLYIFTIVHLEDINMLATDDYERKQNEVPWEVTNIEFMFDFSNEADWRGNMIKIRMNDQGFMNLEMMDPTDKIDGAAVIPYVQNASVRSDRAYTIELAVNIAAVWEWANVTRDGDVELGGPWAAGKQVGLTIFSQEMQENEANALAFSSRDQENARANQPLSFDYFVLSANEVNAASAGGGNVDTPADTGDGADAAEGGGGTTTGGGTTGGGGRTNQQHGDAVTIIFVMLAIALAAGVVFFKKSKKTSV